MNSQTPPTSSHIGPINLLGKLWFGLLGMRLEMLWFTVWTMVKADYLFRNPVLKTPWHNMPMVTRYNGFYYLVYGSWSSKEIAIYQSDDLEYWGKVGSAFANGSLPKWALKLYNRAQIVVMKDGTFRMYFDVKKSTDYEQMIGVATAENILGPYSWEDVPLVITADWPFVLYDNDIIRMYYREPFTRLVVGVTLSDDGLRITSKRHDVIKFDKEWEFGLIEHVTVILIKSEYFIYYGTRGQIGLAKSDKPFENYRKYEVNPVMRKNFTYFYFYPPQLIWDYKHDNYVGIYSTQTVNYHMIFVKNVYWVNGWPLLNNTVFVCYN